MPNINEVHLPTIGGVTHVITSSKRVNATYFSYYALISQAGTNDPTAIVNEKTFNPSIALTRTGVGIYTIGGLGIFVEDKLEMIVGSLRGALERVELFWNGTLPELRTYNNAGVLTDGLLNKTTVRLDMLDEPAPQNTEEDFEDLIEDLDKNQERLWIKAVLRDGQNVTEVDGDTYRRTLDFTLSSRQIQS